MIDCIKSQFALGLYYLSALLALINRLPGTLEQWCQIVGIASGLAGFILTTAQLLGVIHRWRKRKQRQKQRQKK